MHENKAPKQARTLPRNSFIRQVMRAGGPGGQHQNKTESAVRLIHIATGLVAESRSERGQSINEEKAMALLIAKIEARERSIREAAGSAAYLAKPEASFGGSQLRSYVLDKDRRVIDHRTGIVDGRPDEVLRGKIDGFVEAELRSRL